MRIAPDRVKPSKRWRRWRPAKRRGRSRSIARAAEQAIQPIIIELNSKPAADKARTSAKGDGVDDDGAPFTNHGSDI
jgi:hypothetical protein